MDYEKFGGQKPGFFNNRLLAEVGNRQQATGNRVRDFKEKRAKKDFTSDFCKRSNTFAKIKNTICR
ncbi:MAG: hypothetical protein SXA11_25925 [Cyanobacteriota bacterium]|nr:hypothetical protein [Cyanobacteriota bacterium]